MRLTHSFLILPLVNGVNICNPGGIFGFGKVVKLGNVIFASRVLRLGEVVQIGNFGFASFVISFGSLSQSSDFIFAGFVFSVKLSVELGNICDASLKNLNSIFGTAQLGLIYLNVKYFFQ